MRNKTLPALALLLLAAALGPKMAVAGEPPTATAVYVRWISDALIDRGFLLKYPDASVDLEVDVAAAGARHYAVAARAPLA